jgi:hypothetical protein
MSVGISGYSPEALSRSTRLVRAYADSVDGNVNAEVGAILDEVGRDKTELHNLVASLAGLAAHAVRAIAVRLEADVGVEHHLPDQLPRLSEQRTKVLDECADALQSWANKRERRSGLDRRLGSERRRLAPGNPIEQVNLRLFGERRSGLPDRRSGTDRRDSAGNAPLTPTPDGAHAGETGASPSPRRLGIHAHAGRVRRPRP